MYMDYGLKSAKLDDSAACNRKCDLHRSTIPNPTTPSRVSGVVDKNTYY